MCDCRQHNVGLTSPLECHRERVTAEWLIKGTRHPVFLKRSPLSPEICVSVINYNLLCLYLGFDLECLHVNLILLNNLNNTE